MFEKLISLQEKKEYLFLMVGHDFGFICKFNSNNIFMEKIGTISWSKIIICSKSVCKITIAMLYGGDGLKTWMIFISHILTGRKACRCISFNFFMVFIFQIYYQHSSNFKISSTTVINLISQFSDAFQVIIFMLWMFSLHGNVPFLLGNCLVQHVTCLSVCVCMFVCEKQSEDEKIGRPKTSFYANFM